jgi:class 3 adenylate cyclase
VVHLNEYFDAMVGAITSEGGVVDKFIGDAVMAVFGGVIDLENPAESAFNAAGRMRERLDELNASWKERGVQPFDNGIGMHWGEVLQGSIGSQERKEFTVIGDSVNTAARLEGLTKDSPHKVIVTDAFYRELPEDLRRRCTDMGSVSVKGKMEEIRIWGVSEAG